MQSTTSVPLLKIGQWWARHASGELEGADGALRRLEPKVMDLLLVLAQHPGEVVWREQLMERLWPGVIVGEDTLARTVSKLRRALGDDVRTPRYVETIAKRGYRLIAVVESARPLEPAAVAAVAVPAAPAAGRRRRTTRLLVAALALLAGVGIWGWLRMATPQPAAPTPDLIARADDYYFQYTQADNASAIALYQRVLMQQPDHAPALAGLANGLVQRRMRWPDNAGRTFRTLGEALAAGHLQQPAARHDLAQALALAQRAVALAPDLAAAHKALGLAHSASGDLEAAKADYQRALRCDPEAWGSLINLGDLLEIQGQAAAALPYFERAWVAMAGAYPRESARIRPWHANLGTLIGDRHRAAGDTVRAQLWYQRVLEEAPDHAGARAALATLE